MAKAKVSRTAQKPSAKRASVKEEPRKRIAAPEYVAYAGQKLQRYGSSTGTLWMPTKDGQTLQGVVTHKEETKNKLATRADQKKTQIKIDVRDTEGAMWTVFESSGTFALLDACAVGWQVNIKYGGTIKLADGRKYKIFDCYGAPGKKGK